MITKRQQACYHEKKEVMEFVGNPLIATLPDGIQQKQLLVSLMKLGPHREEDRQLDGHIRLELLSRIGSLHIPYSNDLFIARNITRCITWGYIARNPVPFAVTEEVLQECGITVPDNLRNYLNGAAFPINGFSVLGISGVGKSSSVLNALRQYPQVYDHQEYHGFPFRCAQLVWLKVDCQGDGSPKGLCAAILQQVDAVLGTSYSSEIPGRISRDALTARVSYCLSSHHLGILVIDDIQNLCSAKTTTSLDMLSFLIYLMETLAIPVIMVGTPKVLPLFQKEFQLAKRATGDGTVRMELFSENSKEWKRFIQGIWVYQYTAKVVPLNDEMRHVFYTESVGNPFLCALLYKLVQDDAITSGEETFGIADVSKVARERLCITTTMRVNMLNGEDEELRTYERLWKNADLHAGGQKERQTSREQKQPSNRQETVNHIVGVLMEQFGINLPEARNLAEQSFTALYDKSIDEIEAYAVTLYTIKLAGSVPNGESQQDNPNTDAGNTGTIHPEG